MTAFVEYAVGRRSNPRGAAFGQEVLPAVREMGKELGLWSPFEANAPVSIAYAKGPTPVAA